MTSREETFLRGKLNQNLCEGQHRIQQELYKS
jgi:hypothetical protein